MSLQRSGLFVFIFMILFVAGIPSESVNAQQRNDSRSTIQKFSSLLQIINYYYVDTANATQLTESAIEALLKELDPHSVYLSKEEVKKANEPLQGNFDGVGIQFQLFHDTILVVAAVPGGPSD